MEDNHNRSVEVAKSFLSPSLESASVLECGCSFFFFFFPLEVGRQESEVLYRLQDGHGNSKEKKNEQIDPAYVTESNTIFGEEKMNSIMYPSLG